MDELTPGEHVLLRVAKNEQVVGYLVRLMVMGEADVAGEYQIADEVMSQLGIDMETFMSGCDLARDQMDQAILNGELGIL